VVDDGVSQDQRGSAPLTNRELTVYRALARLSIGIADAYRRAVAIADVVDSDPTSIVLAGHLAREILNALPRIYPDAPRPRRVEYEQQIQTISLAWPCQAEGDRGPLPGEALDTLTQLVLAHEESRKRQDESLGLVARFDPAHSRTVPLSVGGQWDRLRRRAVALTHIRDLDAPAATAAEARAVVDELTATLHAIFAPFYESMDVIDALLTSPDGPSRVDELAAALKTPAQFAHFFGQADLKWLEPLTSAGFFNTPPGLEDAGAGYVRTPGWPEGDYLARMAPLAPQHVAAIAERIPLGDNPQIARVLLAVASGLPDQPAARLAVQVAPWFSRPLTLMIATPSAIELLVRLATSGQCEAAVDLLSALLGSALVAQAASDNWHLSEVLDAAEGLPDSCLPRVAGLLQDRLVEQLDSMGDAGAYSSHWLRRVDRVSRHWSERPGRLATALYRTLVRAPVRNSNGAIRSLLQDPHPVLNRIALAVAADHAGRVGPVDEILSESSRWDAYETRYEFRQLVRERIRDASPLAQERLLEYVEAAEEVLTYLSRLQRGEEPLDVDLEQRRWRTRLIGAIFDDLPPDWQARLGPMVDGEPSVEERPEPEAHFVSQSRYSAPDLAGMSPDTLISLVRDWQPDRENPWHSRAGLAEVMASAIVNDLPPYLAALPRFVEGGYELVASIARHVAQAVQQDETLTAETLGEFIETAFTAAQEPNRPGSLDRGEVVGNLAWLIEQLGTHRRVDGSSDSAQRVTRVLTGLLDTIKEGADHPDRTPPNDWDALTAAMNSAGGRVVLAVGPFVVALAESGGATTAKALLRHLADLTEADVPSVIYAAMGSIFPQVVRSDPDSAAIWSERLFGPGVDLTSRNMAFEAYVTQWQFRLDIGSLLAPAYEDAVRAIEEGRGFRGAVELGQHLISADLIGLPQARDLDWVERWYANASTDLKPHATRLLAEAAKADRQDIRERARELLRWRAEVADDTPAHGELEEVTWVSSATTDANDVLSSIVLPAMRRARGRVADVTGVTTLMADQAESQPAAVAEALRLLIDGDEYGSVPHLAEGQLRLTFSRLLASADGAVVDQARQMLHDLGARGSRQFRDLLGHQGAT
jgi:hypothetical protein